MLAGVGVLSLSGIGENFFIGSANMLQENFFSEKIKIIKNPPFGDGLQLLSFSTLILSEKDFSPRNMMDSRFLQYRLVYPNDIF